MIELSLDLSPEGPFFVFVPAQKRLPAGRSFLWDFVCNHCGLFGVRWLRGRGRSDRLSCSRTSPFVMLLKDLHTQTRRAYRTNVVHIYFLFAFRRRVTAMYSTAVLLGRFCTGIADGYGLNEF